MNKVGCLAQTTGLVMVNVEEKKKKKTSPVGSLLDREIVLTPDGANGFPYHTPVMSRTLPRPSDRMARYIGLRA